jgi:hypothetical protein
MSAPQSLLQAALNRLRARLGSGLADSLAGLAVIAQEAPERVRREVQLFWQEVEQEAERLETGSESTDTAGATAASGAEAAESGVPTDPSRSGVFASPQDQIDDLRERVAALSRRLEDRC